MQYLLDILEDQFGSKGEKVVKLNHDVARAGFEYVMEHYADAVVDVLKPRDAKRDSLLWNGNDAVSMGAIAAGVQFVSIYPMTPTSNILAVMSPHQEKYGFVYRQPEDEISAINMAIG